MFSNSPKQKASSILVDAFEGFQLFEILKP